MRQKLVCLWQACLDLHNSNSNAPQAADGEPTRAGGVVGAASKMLAGWATAAMAGIQGTAAVRLGLLPCWGGAGAGWGAVDMPAEAGRCCNTPNGVPLC